MTRVRRKKANVNAPAVPFFLAAVLGLLIDAKFNLGLAFWRASFWIAITFAVIAALLVNARFYFRNQTVAKEKRGPFVRPFLLVNFFALLAFASLAGFRYERFCYYFPESEIGRYVPEEGVPGTLKLQVANTPRLYRNRETVKSSWGQTPYSTSFNAKVLAAKSGGTWRAFTGRIAVSVHGDLTYLHVGDRITVSGKLGFPSKTSNPGERDRIFNYRSQRILTTFTVTNLSGLSIESDGSPSFQTRVARFFERLRLRSGAVLSSRLSPRNAAVARGMTLGFRSDVDEDTNDAFRRTGTIHLLAISGLHIALVVGAFVFILRRLGLPVVCIALLTIALTLFYIELTDMRAPVIRASVLIVTLSAGACLGRKAVTLNTLSIAALIILAINPCELFQLGAQLSFLATGAFLWSVNLTIRERAESNAERQAALRERERLAGSAKVKSDADSVRTSARLPRTLKVVKGLLRRGGRSLWGQTFSVAKASLCIWTVGTPLLLRTTNLLTPIAIIANPLIWIPATFALLLAFLLIISGVLSQSFAICEPLADLIAFLTNGTFDFFLGVLDLFASPSFGAIHIPTPAVWTLWLFYLPLLFWTLYPAFRPRRRYLLLGLFAWTFIYVETLQYERLKLFKTETLRCDVLAVGHGCAVLGVFPDGRTFLYDCGSIGNVEQTAETAAKDLWDLGKSSVDLAIVSHADFDHFGALGTLSDLVEIKRICVSPAMFVKPSKELSELQEKLAKKGIPIEVVSAGDSFAPFGFPEMNVLHPPLGEAERIDAESNANSLVVCLEHLGRRVLLPGDLDSKKVSFLSWKPIKFDVALAPHHGGASQNVEELLEWARPETIVISGGAFTRNYESEEELRDLGYEVFHTQDDGCVRIEVSRDAAGGQGTTRVRAFRSGRETRL